MVKLSIIIPAYNEEDRIRNTLNSYVSFFNKNYRNKYEIMVIPNNSSYNTAEIVYQFSKENKQIRIKEIKHFVGKAGAIIEGFKLAKGELVGFVDADNSAPPESFFKLIKTLDRYDGAIGSRWIKGAIIDLKQPLSRRFFSRSFNFIVRFILGLKYYDTQCGSKVFKNEHIKKILPYLSKAQWAFDIDLLYLLKRINSKIKEVPIKWRDDPRTHVDLKKAGAVGFLSVLYSVTFGNITKVTAIEAKKITFPANEAAT